MNNEQKSSVTFLAKVDLFEGEAAHADKNDLMPVVLTPIAGTPPRGREILSGTIADSQKFVVGKTYLVVATHVDTVMTEDGETVQSWNYVNVAERDIEQVVDYVERHPLQAPVIAPKNRFNPSDPESKMRVVEGNKRARRIRDREELEETPNPKGDEKKPSKKEKSA